MKATRIKQVQKTGASTLVSESILEAVCAEIVSLTAKVGFITGARVVSKGGISIGIHSRQFRINTAKLGYNARLCGDSPKGYKRVDVPTWDQRVEFNGIVNKVFDRFKLSASIISGNYTVRSTESGAFYRWPEGGDRGNVSGWSGDASSSITTEKEARDVHNSDKLEKEYAEKRKIENSAKAKAYRAHVRALKKADFIAFRTTKWVGSKSTYSVRIMKLAEFNMFKHHYPYLALSDCRPAYGKTVREAKRWLLVTERLKGKTDGIEKD
jgi:hypothetical protein